MPVLRAYPDSIKLLDILVLVTVIVKLRFKNWEGRTEVARWAQFAEWGVVEIQGPVIVACTG